MTVITFIQHDGSERMVDGDVGLSLMETALKHDIPGIDADCGGGAICGTSKTQAIDANQVVCASDFAGGMSLKS